MRVPCGWNVGLPVCLDSVLRHTRVLPALFGSWVCPVARRLPSPFPSRGSCSCPVFYSCSVLPLGLPSGCWPAEMSVPCSTRSYSRLPHPRLKSRTRRNHPSRQQRLRPPPRRAPGLALDAVLPAVAAAVSCCWAAPSTVVPLCFWGSLWIEGPLDVTRAFRHVVPRCD